MQNIVSSPKKISDKENRAQWYDYYAGYSHSFVRNLLANLGLSKQSVILDPWNGTGATTYSALLEGYSSIGIDLNPVMKVISIAKLANLDQLVLAKKRCLGLRIDITKRYILSDDYLLLWFHEDTANYIRYIDQYLFAHKKITYNEKIEKIDIIQCIIYLTLFNVVRNKLNKFIPSNPTWIKSKIAPHEKIYLSNREIKTLIIEYLNEKLLIAQERTYHIDLDKAKIIHGTASNLPLNNHSVDAIITSPPYCTRIDYGIATLPELSVLVGNKPQQVDLIRRSLTGRTTIDKNLSLHPLNIGKTGNLFLKSVMNHHSRASATYYYKNYYQYFSEITKTIEEIARVLKVNGIFGCVVQDSFYKEIYCDLSTIIKDIASMNDLCLVSRHDFTSKNNMANIHKYAKKYRKKTIATESVLVFQKGVNNVTN